MFEIMLEQKVILLRKFQVFVYEVCSIGITNNVIRCLGISIGFNKEQCCLFHWLKINEDMEKYSNQGKKS